jgi:hypothetical protein
MLVQTYDSILLSWHAKCTCKHMTVQCSQVILLKSETQDYTSLRVASFISRGANITCTVTMIRCPLVDVGSILDIANAVPGLVSVKFLD